MDFSLVGLMLMSAVLSNLWIEAKGHTAYGCRGGQVTLRCSSGTILISEVVLADSSCFRGGCCPQPNDCRGPPSDGYRSSVLRSCNGMASCVVDVEIKSIGCSVFPKNDYARINYDCQAAETTKTALHLRSTTSSAAVASTEIPFQRVSKHNTEAAAAEAGVSSNGLKTMREEEEKRTEITASSPDRLAVKATSATLKFHQTTKLLPPAENEALKQTYKEDSQQPDRMITMTSLIVGGIVIVTTVVAAAVVMALKKRRIPKSTTDQTLVVTDRVCTSAAIRDGREGGGGGRGRGGGGGGGGEENCRSSNIYELIPDIRVGGEGEGGGGGGGGCGDAAKENEYLKPMMDDEDRPYLWIP